MKDMADEEVVVPEKKKKSLVVIIAVLVVVGLVLAGVISYFVTTKLMTDSAGSAVDSKAHDPGVFVKLGDAKEGIIVNVGGIKTGRFLKVGIVMEMNPEKKQNIADMKIIPMAETKILDTTLQILRSQKLDEFDPSKQDELKNHIKEEVNKVLGAGSVYDVYITSFVLQ
jgi:flagellar FliL protein